MTGKEIDSPTSFNSDFSDDLENDLSVKLLSTAPNSPLKGSFLSDSELEEPSSNFSKLIYISFSFVSLLIAIMSVMPMISEIYDQLGYTSLGKINIVVIYISYCTTSIFVPSLVANWKYKTALFVGSLGFIFTMVAGVLTTACTSDPNLFWCRERGYIYTINIGCSIINGISEPILWIAANSYVTGCSTESNRGRYMGIFWSFISIACVIAALLTAFATKYLGQFYFFVGALAFTCLSCVMFILAPDVQKYTSDEENRESVLVKLRKIGRLAVSRKMMPLLPHMFLVGVLLAIYNAFEYEVIVSIIPNSSQADQNYITSIILAVEAAMTIVASYLIGVVSDKIKPKPIASISNFIVLTAIIASYFCVQWMSLPMAYVMASLWGIGYTAIRTLQTIILSKDFKGSIEAFAIAQFVCNFATAIGSLMCIYITNIPTFLLVVGGLLVVSESALLKYQEGAIGKEEEEEETRKRVISLQKVKEESVL